MARSPLETDWSDFGLWIAARAAGLVQYLPDFFLRWRYPVPRIRERLTILAPGVPPGIAVAEGQPSHLTVIDPPAGSSRGSRSARRDLPREPDHHHPRQGEVLCRRGGEVDRLQFEHDLTDSQAELIRRYPESQPPSDCVLLRISVEMKLRTSLRTQTTTFGVEVQAFVHRGP